LIGLEFIRSNCELGVKRFEYYLMGESIVKDGSKHNNKILEV